MAIRYSVFNLTDPVDGQYAVIPDKCQGTAQICRFRPGYDACAHCPKTGLDVHRERRERQA